MKIGFTGTQIGMTDAQKESFLKLITELKITEFHHGDCVGADEDAHNIVVQYFINLFVNEKIKGKIVIHPPKNSSKRAFCKAIEIREPKEYLKRNHDIVDETQALIGTPKEPTEQLRSGTWATIRYGKKLDNKYVYIIYPYGERATIISSGNLALFVSDFDPNRYKSSK